MTIELDSASDAMGILVEGLFGCFACRDGDKVICSSLVEIMGFGEGEKNKQQTEEIMK